MQHHSGSVTAFSSPFEHVHGFTGRAHAALLCHMTTAGKQAALLTLKKGNYRD
ncbi:hypothetical protein [Yoonia sp.]|uniref:hypothetical protein n=1 Tax=Yoonia sp. TaxID=2212373 RepID=UPI00289D9BD7|nr:hypothetical protein [Yoonia sp.]